MTIYQLTVEVFITKYDLSYREMADALGEVSHVTVKNWHDGTFRPRLSVMHNILDGSSGWVEAFARIMVELLEADF